MSAPTSKNERPAGTSPVGIEAFREALSTVPGPVTVVTACADGRAHATTVSAFCSLSAEPPLVLVALGCGSDLLPVVEASDRFAVHVLGAGNEELAMRCARKGSDKLERVVWRLRRGLPFVEGVGTWIACRKERAVQAGDHVILIGLVEECDVVVGSGLVYHRRAFHGIPHGGDL